MNLGVQRSKNAFLKAEIVQDGFCGMRLGRRRVTHSPCSDAILMCLSDASDFVNDTLAKSCKHIISQDSSSSVAVAAMEL